MKHAEVKTGRELLFDLDVSLFRCGYLVKVLSRSFVGSNDTYAMLQSHHQHEHVFDN